MKKFILYAAFSIAIAQATVAQTVTATTKPVLSKVTVNIPSGALMCPHLGRMLNQNFPKKDGVSNLVISKDYKYAYFDITAERLNNKDSVIQLFNKTLSEYPVAQLKEITIVPVSTTKK
ncbi:MAG: hypothetical protein H7331_00365 [Bacteroidia bacterium]|nr:hypothetical protein [Bacteroidia bacterium]